MSIAFSTSTVAHIIGVSPKWLDNLLSASPLTRAERRRQGLARRLTLENAAQLYIAKTLISELSCSAKHAMGAAEALLARGEIEPCPGLRLIVDRETIEHSLKQLLMDAVQATPPRTRGRPPNRVDPEPDFPV